MLDPITASTLADLIRTDRRLLADLHRDAADAERRGAAAQTGIAAVSARIEAVTADLDRDDQARADAGDDLPAEDHVPFSSTLADAAACRVCSADGTKTEG